MYLTVKQAAERLQVCNKTIFRRIQDGSIKAFKLGEKTIRIDEAELKRYIESLKTA